MSENLAVIMPVYNEEESINKVLDEWIPKLDELKTPYCIFAFDDGSKDSSFQILSQYGEQFPGRVKAIQHPNKGHGQTCIKGYKQALSEGYEYILQIDSDGQCDAKYLQEFWNQRHHSPVLGYRVSRDDGQSRWWISRLVSLVGLLGTGTWVKDANVPYRLIHRDQLLQIVNEIPDDFHLANILISLKLRQKFKLYWIKIHFRDRFGGSPSIKTFNFAEQGLKLLTQLWMSHNKTRP